MEEFYHNCYYLLYVNAFFWGMLIKEYRICMPLTVEEYKIGQLYMIAKHSHEQSERGEGVAVIRNEPCFDEVHGHGQMTEKRIYLSSRLPGWIASIVPSIFYITERAWNYYPYTITEYTCSFIPRFSIHIETRYENNNGCSDNCLGLRDEEYDNREVDVIDIAFDEFPEKYYKEDEDVTKFKSKKTNRGCLQNGWINSSKPIMCSYKVVRVKFEVWGLQTRVEAFVQKAVRDILLVGHRQAFAWIDEWYGMTIDDIRGYESRMHEATNQKVGQMDISPPGSTSSAPSTPHNTPMSRTPTNDEPCPLGDPV